MKLFLYRIICGFFLGISVVAPGFSGAIVAIAMGVYHELLRIISNPLKNLRQNIMFCLPLIIGCGVSLVLFILTFRQLFEAYETAIFILFIGLIAGNIPIIYMEVKKIGFKAYYLIGAVLAFALAVSLGFFATETGLVSGSLTQASNWVGVAIGGAATGATALIPGMSLATVLLLLGLYEPIIFAGESLLRTVDFAYLIPLGIFLVFVVVGLMLTAKGIKYAFKKHPGFANTAVLGFMFGSLVALVIRVIDIQAYDQGFNWLIGALMFVIGIGASILLVTLGKRMNKSES